MLDPRKISYPDSWEFLKESRYYKSPTSFNILKHLKSRRISQISDASRTRPIQLTRSRPITRIKGVQGVQTRFTDSASRSSSVDHYVKLFEPRVPLSLYEQRWDITTMKRYSRSSFHSISCWISISFPNYVRTSCNENFHMDFAFLNVLN